MEVGKMYAAKSGEAFRVIEVDEKEIHLATFEGEYVLNGEVENFKGLMEATGMKEIPELEYKHRVVAMRMFQDMKNDKDYPYKDSYLPQFEEIKDWEKDTIEGFFTTGGGFRDYENETH